MAKAKEQSEVVSGDDIIILPPEVVEKINSEIASIQQRGNVTDALIKKLAEEYGGLTIKDSDDKEGYLNLQAGRKVIKNVRVAAEKLFDEGREPYVVAAAKWLESKKGVVKALKAIEEPLLAMEKDYEAKRDAKKALEDQRREEQGIKRTAEIMGFGGHVEAGSWVLGDISYEMVLLKNVDEDIYQGIRDQFKAIFDVNEKAKADKAEEDRMAADKLLKDQQDLAKQQAEVKKMRTEGRISFLKSLGMMRSQVEDAYFYGILYVWDRDIEEKESQDWEVVIAGAKEGIEKSKSDAKKKEEENKIFETRLPKLKGWGFNGSVLTYPEGIKEAYRSKDTLIEMPEENFTELVKDNDLLLADLEEKKEEKRLKDLEDARLEGIGKSRRQILNDIECKFPGTDKQLGEATEEDWSNLHKDAKALFDKDRKDKADKKEKERLEEIGEKGRYEELVKYLKAAPIGEYRSSQYRTKVSPIRTFIEGLK